MKLDYKQRMILGSEALSRLQLPGVCVVDIKHDGDCKVFKNKECNCVPDIEVKVGDKLYIIDEEGVLK